MPFAVRVKNHVNLQRIRRHLIIIINSELYRAIFNVKRILSQLKPHKKENTTIKAGENSQLGSSIAGAGISHSCVQYWFEICNNDKKILQGRRIQTNETNENWIILNISYKDSLTKYSQELAFSMPVPVNVRSRDVKSENLPGYINGRRFFFYIETFRIISFYSLIFEK